MDDALIAFAQNGERLRPEQGYPVRLLLPGYEGNMSVKWLRRLKVGNSAVHDAGRDVQIHRLVAGRTCKPVQLRDGGEVGHHPPRGRRSDQRRPRHCCKLPASRGRGPARSRKSTSRWMAAGRGRRQRSMFRFCRRRSRDFACRGVGMARPQSSQAAPPTRRDMCSRHAKRYWLPAAPDFTITTMPSHRGRLMPAGKVTNLYAASA